jgi:hypothetical protein
MKKIIIFSVCTALCMWLTACVGPGTGPYGVYTEADRYRDTVHTAAAVVVGASVFGHIFHHGRHYGHHRVYTPHAYYAPVMRPLPRGYIYR